MEKNYKETLLIQQTNFDMKADLKTKEPNIEKTWLEQDIYNQKIALNSKKSSFTLHDGPPYANGNIHVGHALNKILKDFIVRWKNSTGFNSQYIMGWDTHGLPIETAVTKTGVDRKSMPAAEFRKLCEAYALEQVENQCNQFKRLGIFTDYDKKYITLTHDYEISQLRLFAKMVEKKLVYRDLKPIYWSPSSESALAEAEIEYAEVKSPTIFVACPIIENNDFVDSHLVIWTTTPWTIPSNQLIAVGQDIEYSEIINNETNKKYIFATNLLANAMETIGWQDYSVVRTLSSSELLNLKYQHPWFENKTGFVVIGHHVTDEAGTGLVHTAGGFGEDDFAIVNANGIKAFAPIDDQGKFDVTIEDSRLEGVFYEDANKIIGVELDNKGLLLKLKFVKHSYPHDWRTKKPVIYRATHQWFVSLEPVKEEIDKTIVANVTTNPSWSKERLRNIIKDRNDWTISRQRLWGVPIIAFYDAKKQPIMDMEAINYAIEQIEKLGTNAWFEMPTDTFLPEKYKNQNIEKEKDILDVWFDSGSSNIAMQENFGLQRPFDVYLEGNDQYRGWFNSSMINSVIYDGKPAYKQLLTHGMTNDEKGKKMSKSIGNTIDPLEIANDLGSDILRLWVCSTDFTDDQRIGKEILKQIAESYRKIRNTIRFILSNLVDFDPIKNYQTQLSDVDKFALHNLTVTKEKFIETFDNYNFNNAFKLINNYVINDLSSFYLDFIKDIIYVEAQDSLRRRQVQTVMYEQLWMLIDMLRAIIPHTIEEVYQNITNIDHEQSVHLLDVKIQDFKQSQEFIEIWNNVLKLRDDVNEALEKARNEKIIKKGFEAKINITLKPQFSALKDIQDLSQILIVNSIEFNSDSDQVNGTIGDVNVQLKEGQKCQRCWAIFDQLVEDICQRCYDVIN
ncbi:isoleucine--tRNA ligase [Spiroplasma culicicola]|uniref:Isoleucine--tRNA ligase n=1 Tax=Spiroplasma culicicola AES-1 TaxID=1276246 RepID=W6A7J1_9MOLU|nr:isoleucine--tRNA ligase [Spiroplasma culicicola]AHI53108.1 isoleucyl-tRNA synthetase [Spiroplasma culicicola AES-1]